MGDVFSISGGPYVFPEEIQETVITRIEDLAARARAGKIKAFAFAAIEDDGLPMTCFGGEDLVKLLGAVLKLQARMLDG